MKKIQLGFDFMLILNRASNPYIGVSIALSQEKIIRVRRVLNVLI